MNGCAADTRSLKMYCCQYSAVAIGNRCCRIELCNDKLNRAGIVIGGVEQYVIAA